MSETVVIFPCDPLNERQIDPPFAHEAEYAGEAGLLTTKLDHDYLDQRLDAVEAVRRSRLAEATLGIYRGWMMRVEAYSALYEALESRGVRLLTTPTEYESCHHAPGSYQALATWMPETKFLPVEELDVAGRMESALAHFGTGPIIIKDWVKSQAGYWETACFIPDASDTRHALAVIARFRELQGDTLIGGIVLKAYKPLLRGKHQALEYRALVFNGRSLGCWPRSDEVALDAGPPQDLIDAVSAAVPSTFASADFGLDEDGRWWLLEVGDGQVSELPSKAAGEALYRALSALYGSCW
jgi:hypothetical protein